MDILGVLELITPQVADVIKQHRLSGVKSQEFQVILSAMTLEEMKNGFSSLNGKLTEHKVMIEETKQLLKDYAKAQRRIVR